LQSLDRGWITNVQIEACRVAINRFMKRKGRLWLRIYPDKPFTKKPLETRMGKGKGAVEAWVAVVRPGTMMFEMDGVSEAQSREALRLAAFKLPVKSRFVSRHARV
jgi:large subunit ribosomal protein L16